MIHRAERKRLLVFSDNRQDAASQAGWMQDHARRYRLRALMLRDLVTLRYRLGRWSHSSMRNWIGTMICRRR
jgi:hypothetical protein